MLQEMSKKGLLYQLNNTMLFIDRELYILGLSLMFGFFKFVKPL